MAEWDAEPMAYEPGYFVVHGLWLDDGTYLENYETEIQDADGNVDTFETFGTKRMQWFEDGELKELAANDIQRRFDSGEFEVHK